MKVLILAAGYATRLYPLTRNMPKPLLLINGRPIVEHIIKKLENLAGLDAIFVVTNQKFLANFQRWQMNFACKKPVELINDKTTRNSQRLGAIGDMALAISEKGLDDDLLVVGGDNLFDFEIDGFVEFAKARGSTVGVYDVGEPKRARKFGIVSLNGENRITRFEEKPEHPGGTLAALAIYYFPKSALGLLHEYLKVADKKDAPGHYIDWLSKKENVYGHVFGGNWYDIGDIASYNRAKNSWAH